MLPALMRAEKVGKKASCFDFENSDQVLDFTSDNFDFSGVMENMGLARRSRQRSFENGHDASNKRK